MEIDAVQLAQLHVHKPPSLRRTVLNDPQILRREKNHIAQAQQIRCLLDLLSVYGDTLGLVLSQVHVNP